ncbi:PepSY domain-containing protein [Acinetobacter schindleri]|uniref:PepSY domain-containing protein n=1 Tax=Acinetobacter schindleri TaxID=108981 RepID=UPI0016097DBB|nr:sulfite reductase flavoprotein subunit alpha [Acinetobacter schindleri]MBB4834496.1 sulfite reductase (NADPH) flavoprotein alpha-component [Acinetobacter schindleri]WBX38734.1 sulfite reductase flavoprotein subunit alpha [Acinetobacter schindleri]
MFKKTFFQIHWFLGITAGLVLSIMGVTGAIYSYEQQILKWINTDSYTVQAQSGPKLSPAELYQHFKQQNPEMQINSVSLDASPTGSSTVNIAKEGARRGYNMMVNPYTAEVLPEIKGREFFQFIQQLHRYLTMGPVGKQITGACALMLIFFVLSGLYLRWPKRHSVKQWLAVKPQLKGRNFIWDLHAVVGTWVVIFYLILACTGLYWSYDWWRNGMFKVLGVERPQPEMQQGQGGRGGAEQGRSAGESRGEGAGERGPRSEGQRENRGEGRERGVDDTLLLTALNKSWAGFQNEFNDKYSTVTFNIPKKVDGELKLSFTDVEVQHERARNNATYNYQDAAFTLVEMYEDKKLNEKIMSSMLPVHRGSFFGPIYQFFAMVASLLMPLFFITGWMLYLKRRKQKKLTLAARQGATAVDIDPNARPWLIAYATQTGVSEQLAWRTATALQQAHQPATVKAVQQLTLADLQQAEQVLFIASTYGTGEAPDLASSFEKKIMSGQADLSHLHYAVLALGSKEYPDTFCSFGHRIDQWLKNNGAQQLFATIEVDNASNEHIQQWNAALAQSTQLELQAMDIDKTFDHWTLVKREVLNPGSLGAPAFNLEFKPEHEAQWQAGDIAEIQPGNSAERIAQFLAAHQIPAGTVVASMQQRIEDILWNRDLTQPIFPFISSEELLNQLPVLPTREYSIASIPSQQILRLVVRQQKDTSGEIGLGSGWLTQYAALNAPIALRIRSNDSFHLVDDNRPIICIGNGTGIAGLMSLLHTRNRQDYNENWLIFGERQRAHDFFYQETLEAWLTVGTLKRLDLAFSRDQAEKVYVHHKLREQADELKTWVNNGAVIYVCGSIDGMASDVDQALIDILGESTVDQLRQDGRYRRDVY